MTTISYNDNALEIGEESIELRSKIQKVIDTGDMVVVLLDPGSDGSGNTNVVAYNTNGGFEWEIQEAPVDREDKPYMDIREEGGEIIADNWVGIQATIDLDDGELDATSLTK